MLQFTICHEFVRIDGLISMTCDTSFIKGIGTKSETKGWEYGITNGETA